MEYNRTHSERSTEPVGPLRPGRHLLGNDSQVKAQGIGNMLAIKKPFLVRLRRATFHPGQLNPRYLEDPRRLVLGARQNPARDLRIVIETHDQLGFRGSYVDIQPFCRGWAGPGLMGEDLRTCRRKITDWEFHARQRQLADRPRNDLRANSLRFCRQEQHRSLSGESQVLSAPSRMHDSSGRVRVLAEKEVAQFMCDDTAQNHLELPAIRKFPSAV